MSATVVTIGNMILGNANPNFAARSNTGKPTWAASPAEHPDNPVAQLASEAEIPWKAPQNDDNRFKNAPNAEKPVQKGANVAEKPAPESHPAIFDLFAGSEFPQVVFKKALINNAQIPAAAAAKAAVNLQAARKAARNPLAATDEQLINVAQTSPENTKKPQNQPSLEEKNPAKAPADNANPGASDPAGKKPEISQVPKIEANTPPSAALTNIQTPPVNPGRLRSAPKTPEKQPPAKNEDISSLEPVSPQNQKATPNILNQQLPAATKTPQIQPAFAENPKPGLAAQKQPQPVPNSPDGESDMPRTGTPNAKVRMTAQDPNPNQLGQNAENKPVPDSLLGGVAVTHMHSTPAQPKQQHNNQQGKTDLTGGEQILAASESQPRPFEQIAPPATPREPLANTDLYKSIANQVNESVTATIREGNDQVTIRLNPPELGKVSIKFEQREDGITAQIEVAKAQTRVEIQHALPEIVRNLASSGVQIKRFEVNLADNSDPQNYRERSLADQQNQWAGHHDSQNFAPNQQNQNPAVRWFTDAGASQPPDELNHHFIADNSLNMLI